LRVPFAIAIDTHVRRAISVKMPATHENRADHTDGIRSSQDCLIIHYHIENAVGILKNSERCALSPHCDNHIEQDAACRGHFGLL
jgi:hypothetical protein